MNTNKLEKELSNISFFQMKGNDELSKEIIIGSDSINNYFFNTLKINNLIKNKDDIKFILYYINTKDYLNNNNKIYTFVRTEDNFISIKKENNKLSFDIEDSYNFDNIKLDIPKKIYNLVKKYNNN
tara:strand:- start:296 stop:673 length:378 start_codon:yes stop_codon:yes gene_type:complete